MQMQNTANKYNILIIIAAFITVLLYLGGVSSQYKPTPDSSEYMGLAYSIAQGTGYQFNGWAGSHHPPLTSIVLAGIIKISAWLKMTAASIALMKIGQVIFAVIFALGSWRLARRYLSETLARLAGMLVLANMLVFQHCMFILTDALYCCLSIWALVLVGDHRNLRRWGAGVVLIALAWLTRIIGIAMLAGVLFYLMTGRLENIRGKKRWLVAFSVSILIAAPFILWKIFYQSSGQGYFSWFAAEAGSSNLFHILLNRIRMIFPITPLRSIQALLNIEQIQLPLYFTIIIFCVLVFGWWSLFRSRRAFSEWYIVFYMAIISINAEQGPRYFMPVLPMFLIYGIVGVKMITERLAETNRSAPIWQVMTIIVLFALFAPLAGFVWDNHHLPGAMAFLRDGYIYCVLAGMVSVLLLIGCRQERLWSPIRKIAPASFLVIYVGIGWLYFTGYAALEHGLIKSRHPMLAGYEPYYQMGQWLANQPDVKEPIVCANFAIIHLASGKITRPPHTDEQLTLEKLRRGELSSVLLFDQSQTPPKPEEYDNHLVCQMIRNNADVLRQVKTGGNDPFYYMYIYGDKSVAKKP